MELRSDSVHSVMKEMRSQHASTLFELSAAAPVVLVFLRHLGCSFCRQTLYDLQKARPALSDLGVGIALAHMAVDQAAERLFEQYGLEDVPRFSDRQRRFYRAFGLRAARYRELWAPRVLAQGLQAAAQHGVGRPQGDPFQMAGVFLVDQGQVAIGRQFVTAAERPHYVDMVSRQFLPNSPDGELSKATTAGRGAGLVSHS